MRLLVGLGNPGPRYAHNRHNIGFLALDEIVRRHGFGPWRLRFQGQACEGRIGDDKLLALKPETYMNESGRAVGEAARFYKLTPDQVVVLHDEIDLVPGKLRVKRGGGAGGHNGLRSIDAHLGPDYWRVRLGVGHPGHKDLVQRYVLSDFAQAERPLIEKLLDAVAREIPLLIAGDDASFMSRVSQEMAPPRPKPPRPADPDNGGPAASRPGDGQPPEN